MKIYLSPQVNNERIIYEFDNDRVKITINGISDEFDFTGLPDGELELYDHETSENLIQTVLPINPIISAKKKGGVLYLELINWIGENATEAEKFPDWIDASEYVQRELEKEEEKAPDPIEGWDEF